MSSNGIKLSINLGDAGPSKPTNLELLMAKAKPPTTASKPAPKSKPPLSSLFDDEDMPPPSSIPSTSKSKSKSKPPLNLLSSPPKNPAPSLPQPPPQMSRAERQARTQALSLDSTIYDYDSVYDHMKSAERAIEESKKQESEDRKPKYIESFLASAQTRRLDKLRAEEKMLSLEREKEGDEFGDKEKFVTEGYKKQMEEVRKAEEEERKRDEELRKSKKGPGLTSLYKTMLDDSSAKHAAAVAAASGAVDSGPSLAIRPPTKDIYEPEPEYDPFLAAEAKRQPTTTETLGTDGKDEDLGVNDDGEVVNKRSLLKAGLNIMAKPKVELPNSLLTSQRSGNIDGPYKSRAVGTAASYGERIERERKRLAEQLKEDAERAKREHEEKMRAEEEEARKRKEGDDGEAERKRSEAKERFLARKRAREEAEVESKKKAKE